MLLKGIGRYFKENLNKNRSFRTTCRKKWRHQMVNSRHFEATRLMYLTVSPRFSQHCKKNIEALRLCHKKF